MKSARIYLVASLAIIATVPLAYAFRDQAQQAVIDKAQADKRNANAQPDAQSAAQSATQPASDVQASLTSKKVRAGHP
jgi:hypothetical protein